MNPKRKRRFFVAETVSAMVVAAMAIVVLLALVLYARYGSAIASRLAGTTISVGADLGAWGDSFGALNAAVAALGFVGILITLRLQVRSLQEQARDQHRQRFEASFFELLKLQREARRELEFYNTPEFKLVRAARRYVTFSAATTGRLPVDGDIDPIAAADLEIHFQLIKIGKIRNCSKDNVINVYMRYVHSASESTVAPYFRLIYSILDKIRSDHILTEYEKIRYGNLVRSQLSSAEILLLGINSLTPISADMQDLVTEFRMLKYLPNSSMKNMLVRFHDPRAFMGRDDPYLYELERHAEAREEVRLSIVSALRFERQRQCMSRNSLADRLGRPKSFVADYEDGVVKLDLADFVAISHCLGRRPGFFLGRPDARLLRRR